MKKAFTLAETLITISIIGVIAVMAASTLIKNKPDQNALAFKKTFYSIQDALRYLSNDTNLFPNSDDIFWLNREHILDNNKPEDPDALRVLNGKDYQQYFCEQVAAALNTTGSINCGSSGNDTTDGTISRANDVEFQLQNGAVLNGFNQEFDDEDNDNNVADVNGIKLPTKESITVCVDVNGLKKGPNKGCANPADDRSAKNRDQFRFRVHYDGKVSTGEGDAWAAENAILEETGINK